MDIDSLPRPQRLDRVRCINPLMKEFFNEPGILVHNAPNPNVASIVVFDKNPRAEAVLFARDFISERFKNEVDFADLQVNYVAPVVEDAPVYERPASSIPKRGPGRPAKVKAEEPIVAKVPGKRGRPAIVRPEGWVAPVKVPSNGFKGRVKTTVLLTPEIIAQAIAAYNTGRGMVEVAKELNAAPVELSAAFKAQGVVLKKGKRAA